MFYRKINYFIFTDKFRNIYVQNRNLARFASRRPVDVIPSEEYDEKTDSRKNNTELDSENDFHQKVIVPKHVKPLTISKKKQVPKITMDMLETTIDNEGNFIYTKMKNNDSRITRILTEVKSGTERSKNNLMLLEGKRLIKDALDANCKLEYLLFSRFKELEYIRPSIPKMGAKLYKMPYKEIQMWSNLTTSPGIMGVFKIPDLETYEVPETTLPLTVICDNIREADNLGAILRTCSGVGCKEVILSKGCVNVWDSKVLRSACGAHFKLKVKRKIQLNDLENNIPPNSNIFLADNRLISLNTVDVNVDSELLTNIVSSLPLVPYFSVNYTKCHNVLIVGGETEGISEECYKLVSNFNGTRLNIPLENKVDSLNVGTALGIIVFEIKRQYLLSKAQSVT